MTTSETLARIRAILYDEAANDYRELNSCADAVQDICMALEAHAPKSDRVFLLLEETSGDSDGAATVIGVFSTEQGAKRARATRRATIAAERRRVLCTARTEAAGTWEVDHTIEEQAVQA
jgi:hypothetical protein